MFTVRATHSSKKMVRAYDSVGTEIPTSVATSFAVWKQNRNFRTYGLEFDTGYGASQHTLDVDNSSGTQGFIAFCRGRNEYLPGALCEAYPEVREFFLHLVKDCIEAGVDGIDFRIQDHSTFTDDAFSYGFNAPIVDEYQKRYGLNILTESYDPDLLAQLRGEYFTDFLRSTASKLHSEGMKMQVHINWDLLNFYLTYPEVWWTFPMNIKFDWEGWLQEGFVDEATFRSFKISENNVFTDFFSRQIVTTCRDMGVPLHFNRYVNVMPVEDIREAIRLIRGSDEFQSYFLYEGKRFICDDGAGGVTFCGDIYGTLDDWVQIRESLYGE